LYIKRHVTHARLQVSDDGQTVLVSADWPMKSRDASFWRKIFGGNTEYGWKSSQHVFISILGMNRNIASNIIFLQLLLPRQLQGRHAAGSILLFVLKETSQEIFSTTQRKRSRRGTVSMDLMALYTHWR
jgi:hypothetical protein